MSYTKESCNALTTELCAYKSRAENMSKKLAEINGRLAKGAETKTCLTECCERLAALSDADHIRRDATETNVRATTKRMLARLERAESDVADEQRKVARREEALRGMMDLATVYSRGAKRCVDGLRADNDRLVDELETSRATVDALCAQVAALDACGPGEGPGERGNDEDDDEDEDRGQACSESVSTSMSVDDSFVVGSRSNPAFVDGFPVDGLLPWSSVLFSSVLVSSVLMSSSTDGASDSDGHAVSSGSLSLNEMFCKYAANSENCRTVSEQ